MRKVIFVLPTLNIGGIERVTIDIIKSLRRFYEIHLCVLNDDGLGFNVPENVYFHNLNVSRARYAFFELDKFLSKFKNSLIISPVSYITVLLCLLKNKNKLKIISIEHGLVSHRFNDINSKIYKNIYKFLLRRSLGLVDGFVFVSHSTKRDWIEFFKFNFDNSKVIYNKIDFDNIDYLSSSDLSVESSFEKKEIGANVVISIARLSEEKNIILGCQTFLELKKIIPDSIYVILGDGPQRVIIENWINENNMQDSIMLMGFQTNPYYFLSKSKLLLLTSNHEALPTVVIEALYMNKKVVSVNCPGGIGEICSNINNAYIVETCCPSDISRIMELALKNKDEFNSKQIIVNKFGNDKIIQDYINLIEKVYV